MPVHDVVTMAGFRTIRFLAFACLILGINATVINPDEPLLIASCKNGIFYAPMATLSFTTSRASMSAPAPADVSYDPIDQKIYYSGASPTGIYKMDLDGSNHEVVDSVPATVLLVDPEARKLYYYSADKLYRDEIDPSSAAEIPFTKKGDSYPRNLVKIGSRIFVVGVGPSTSPGIAVLNIDTQMLDIDELYDQQAVGADIDPAARLLYYVEEEDYHIKIIRQDVAETALALCSQTVVDTSNIHTSSSPDSISPNDMAIHKGFAYVAVTGAPLNAFTGLLRFDIQTGAMEHVGSNMLFGGECDHLYIHDPCKIEAGRAFNGSLNPPLVEVNYTTPVNMTIPIDIRETWFGGMTADFVIPITGPMLDWHLEISFPRQVFNLEIEGCDAEISDKKTVKYGRRKGTDFVISPSPGSCSPTPGQDLTISTVAKTWKDVRMMKRGISAMFVPVAAELVCDMFH